MRQLLLIVCALGACSKGAEADLPTIGEARSLAAEWALVNEQQTSGRVTAVYADTMRRRLREQLQSDFTSLTQPQSNYGKEIHAILAAPANASPEQLRSHAAALKKIEDSLESA